MASRSAVPDSSTGGATTTRAATLRSPLAGPVVVGAATLAPTRRVSTVATLPWPLLGVRPGRGSRLATPTPPMFLNASSIGRSTPPAASTSAIADVPSAARAVISLMSALSRTCASRISWDGPRGRDGGDDGGGAGRGRGVDDGAGAVATVVVGAAAGGGAGRGVRTRWLTKRSGTSSIDGRRGHSTWRR